MRWWPALLSTVMVLFALAGSAGAATEPDDVWTLSFQPGILHHDDTTGITISVSPQIDAPGTSTYRGLDQNGSVVWTLTGLPDQDLVVHNGAFYTEYSEGIGDTTVRAYDATTGQLNDEWTLPGRVSALQASDARLWFAFEQRANSQWTDATTAFLELATGTLNPSLISANNIAVTPVDVTDDGTALYVSLGTNHRRYDVSGTTPVLTHQLTARSLRLSNDETTLYGQALNTDIIIVDPANLAVIRSTPDSHEEFQNLVEARDGLLVGIIAGNGQNLLNVMDAATLDIIGRGLPGRWAGASTVEVIGDSLAVGQLYENRVDLYDI